MEKGICVGIIGSGSEGVQIVEAIMKERAMDNVIIVGAGESLAEQIRPVPSFKLERVEPVLPQIILHDFTDGKTARRERRKRQRRNK